MASCSSEFEKYTRKAPRVEGELIVGDQPGLWIGLSHKEPPHHHPSRITWLHFESDQGRFSVPINFCPWCGRDLKSNPKAPWKRH
jgi:hypothetical protein